MISLTDPDVALLFGSPEHD